MPWLLTVTYRDPRRRDRTVPLAFTCAKAVRARGQPSRSPRAAQSSFRHVFHFAISPQTRAGMLPWRWHNVMQGGTGNTYARDPRIASE